MRAMPAGSRIGLAMNPLGPSPDRPDDSSVIPVCEASPPRVKFFRRRFRFPAGNSGNSAKIGPRTDTNRTKVPSRPESLQVPTSRLRKSFPVNRQRLPDRAPPAGPRHRLRGRKCSAYSAACEPEPRWRRPVPIPPATVVAKDPFAAALATIARLESRARRGGPTPSPRPERPAPFPLGVRTPDDPLLELVTMSHFPRRAARRHLAAHEICEPQN